MEGYKPKIFSWPPQSFNEAVKCGIKERRFKMIKEELIVCVMCILDKVSVSEYQKHEILQDWNI